MRPVCLAACLFFLIFTSPLFAQTSIETQPVMEDEDAPIIKEYPPGDRLFFFEDIFISEGNFLFNEPVVGEEIYSDEELLSEEDFSAEEIASGEQAQSEDSFSTEEIISGEETSVSEASASHEETSGEQTLSEASFPADENFPGEETSVSEADLPDEEIIPDDEKLSFDDTYSDEYAYLFEAPPLVFEVPTFENRSIDTLFPNFTQRQKSLAMNNLVLRYSYKRGEAANLIPNPDLEIDLLTGIMKKNPSHLIEALLILPYNERELDLLDIYNALGRIQNIKDCSVLVRGNDYYIFTESTRIDNTRNRRAISDPAPAVTLPFSETMYLRLKEVSFGNLFLRGDISISMYGITYSMTNFTDVRYFLVPIMGAERYSTIIYLEPIKEGILIYSITGFYLPGFIADRVNLTPSINRRIDIFIKWISDGLKIQESASAAR